MKLGLFFSIVMIGTAHAQTERRTFEVASIRLNPKCDANGPSRGASSPTSLAMECADLRDLIVTAYGIYASGSTPVPGRFRMQVSGGPGWIDTQRFEILATAAPQSSTAEMLGPMLRSLLEDRFGLKVHRETKQGAIYTLTVAKNGPKLPPSSEAGCVMDRPPTCGSVSIHSNGEVDFRGVNLTDLGTRLSMVLDREVVDATGLSGKYDFHLQVAPGDLNPRFVAGRDQEAGEPNSAERGSSIFSALQQQLGLKLDSGRGPIESIVVDQIDHPTEN